MRIAEKNNIPYNDTPGIRDVRGPGRCVFPEDLQETCLAKQNNALRQQEITTGCQRELFVLTMTFVNSAKSPS